MQAFLKGVSLSKHKREQSKPTENDNTDFKHTDAFSLTFPRVDGKAKGETWLRTRFLKT